jgi:cyclic-di-AMP phosphodiesterase PgpH
LEKPTPQKIESLVNELIEQRIADRQLDDCDLTLGELKIIAERFRFTLTMMLHSRIAYPKHVAKPPAAPRDEALRPDVMAARRKPETAPPVSAA